MFLDFAMPAILLTIYLDSRTTVGSVRTGGSNVRHPNARSSNLLFIALTLVLTATLVRMSDIDPDLRTYIRSMVAFMAAINMTVHWVICQFFRRLTEKPGPIPATVLSMYRDSRRINYLDQAAYWTLVFEGLPYLWDYTG